MLHVLSFNKLTDHRSRLAESLAVMRGNQQGLSVHRVGPQKLKNNIGCSRWVGGTSMNMLLNTASLNVGLQTIF